MKLRDSAQYYHLVLRRIPSRALPAFEDEDMQARVWGRRWGVYDDVGPLRTVLLHRPGEEIMRMTSDRYDPELDTLIDDEEQWYFRSDRGPDLGAMQREHDAFAEVLRGCGAEVVYLEGGPRDPNAMFVRDNGIVVKGGAVVGRMGPVGKPYGTGRRGEEAFLSRKLAELGMPILHTVHGAGLLEGGSFTFLNERTAVVGTSSRQNAAGVDQLRCVLRHQDTELLEVPLVGYSMHLDGALLMVDRDKALVQVERLPFWFLEKLAELGIEAIPVDYRDDGGAAINCLVVAPGKVILDASAVWTAELLTKRGCTVLTTPYEECRKHGGGLHCSSLPLLRDRS